MSGRIPNLYPCARSRARSMWSTASLNASSGLFRCSRATMYAAYHPDQWCFGAVGSYSPWRLSASRRSSVRVATSMMPPWQRARSNPSGKPRLDLLEQPAVAVRIAEPGKGAVRTAFRVRARQACPLGSGVMEQLTDVGAAGDELGACRLDVEHHEIQALG